MKTDALIAHLSQYHPQGYDLSLGRILGLLQKLGNPQNNIPPVFHVAGTNGKGSVIANLRFILETAGYSVHTHNSPHLVNFTERFRLGHELGHDKNAPQKFSKFIEDKALANALSRVAEQNGEDKITIFELLIATMFLVFHEHKADYSLIEVGLGGRFDATNIIAKPLATIITPISMDHQSHLGDTLEKIAFEKAGIIKTGCPVIVAPQEDSAREVIENVAREKQSPIVIGGQDFDFYEQGGRFIYQDEKGLLDLPLPKLVGEHQLANSATAIAALRFCNIDIDDDIYEQAMPNLNWPGRMERLPAGKLQAKLPANAQLWIDGGHNEAAANTISNELQKLLGSSDNPPILILAMLKAKDPIAFLEKFKPLNPTILTVPIISSEHGIDQDELANIAIGAGFEAQACSSLHQSLEKVGEIVASEHNSGQPSLITACGSLYLIGEILKENGTAPQ